MLDIRASAASSVATLINVGIGAGILSLPFAFACTGWALGLALTGRGVGSAFAAVSTCCLLCAFGRAVHSECVKQVRSMSAAGQLQPQGSDKGNDKGSTKGGDKGSSKTGCSTVISVVVPIVW